jgi:hypothetical protein
MALIRVGLVMAGVKFEVALATSAARFVMGAGSGTGRAPLPFPLGGNGVVKCDKCICWSRTVLWTGEYEPVSDAVVAVETRGGGTNEPMVVGALGLSVAATRGDGTNNPTDGETGFETG